MDEDTLDMGEITREDVIDAIEDPENAEALNLLTQYFNELNARGASMSKRLQNAKSCAQMLYGAKRYEDVGLWLDTIATQISDEEGPDSDAYMAFTEDEELEELRIKANDKSIDAEEEEDFEIEDE